MKDLLQFKHSIIGKFKVLENGCWQWTAGKTKAGYGHVGKTINGKMTKAYAHRISYTIFIGIIPEGLSLDHLCRNTSCINPLHLEPVTHRENLMRSPSAATSLNAKKTHCVKGHEFTPENTLSRQRVGRLPERSCRTCRDIRNANRMIK